MHDQNKKSRFSWLHATLEILLLPVVLVVLLPVLAVLFGIAMIRLRKLRFGNYRPSIWILGVQIWNTTIDEAVSHIIKVLRGRGESQPVFFVNAACFNVAASDPEYQEIMNGPGSVLVDGIGVKLAGMVTDQPVRENVNGTDLFPRLCEAIENSRVQGEDFGRIYLLGAQSEAVEGTAEWIRENYPAIQVVGARDGYYPPEEIEQVLEEIRQSKADLLFVAMGAPHQEKWIDKHLQQTGVRIAMGVGGLFDFYSGRISRAPRLVRKIGFEWLYRLLQEPRRMARRYVIGNATFLWKIFRYGTEYPGKMPSEPTRLPAEEVASEEKLYEDVLGELEEMKKEADQVIHAEPAKSTEKAEEEEVVKSS